MSGGLLRSGSGARRKPQEFERPRDPVLDAAFARLEGRVPSGSAAIAENEKQNAVALATTQSFSRTLRKKLRKSYAVAI